MASVNDLEGTTYLSQSLPFGPGPPCILFLNWLQAQQFSAAKCVYRQPFSPAEALLFVCYLVSLRVNSCLTILHPTELEPCRPSRFLLNPRPFLSLTLPYHLHFCCTFS